MPINLSFPPKYENQLTIEEINFFKNENINIEFNRIGVEYIEINKNYFKKGIKISDIDLSIKVLKIIKRIDIDNFAHILYMYKK